MDIEQERIATRPMGEQEPQRRGRAEADALIVEFDPGRVHARIVPTLDRMQDRARLDVTYLPQGGTGQDAPRDVPGAGHRVDVHRDPDRLPETLLVERAGDPKLDLDVRGLVGRVAMLPGFLDDIAGDAQAS